MKFITLLTPIVFLAVGASALPVAEPAKGIDWKRNELEERGGGNGRYWRRIPAQFW
ncbi:hypothetical protein SCHPADRAFT_897732 [Schizopora paradoxa]|uniref:Uncharacterized protein n=1 Tax=Schizopora paradoxa TaxID=27342 RepID=A0A0H2SFA8_9AGAM|nr:hypothetical protein SCHPADRAFT_897732 [Schizopora paradoxa]